jgi:hypothetical protein
LNTSRPYIARILATAALSASVAAFSIPAAYGQATTGTMVGTILDKTGATIGKAEVDVVNEDTHVKYHATANAAGEYRIVDLPAGPYDVTVTAPTFATTAIKGVRIDSSKASTVPVSLGAASSASVEVSMEAPVNLDTTTTQLQYTFTTTESQDLAASTIGLQGVLNLALLAPGVSSGGGIGAGTGPSVGGQRTRNNNFTIEGIDNNNQSVAGPSTAIPGDAVGGFTLLTNQFSSEFGHSTGGQFNTTVISGTNTIHGRIYEYFQNRNLNAQDQTIKQATSYGAAPRFDQNRFGGGIGGPIFKDKLFIFADLDKLQTGQSLSRNACAPTAAGYTTLGTLAGVSANNLAQLKKYLPAGTVTDSTTSPVACPKAGTITVAGAVIPVALYQFSSPVFSNSYYGASSLDYTPNGKNNFRIRYLYNRIAQQDTTAQLSSFFLAQPQRNQFVSGSYFRTFSANLTNEFRVGFNRLATSTPAGNFSFTGLDSFPNLQFAEINVQLGPNPNAPQDSIQNLYQVTDNITFVKGKHTLIFGFDGRKYISPSHFTQRVRGDYDYSTLDLYLRDLSPDQLGERSSGNFEYYGDQTAFYGYANDIYRIAPTFTINAGLRYEFTSTPAGVRAQSLNSQASAPGLVNFTAPTPQRTNVVPRVGFAYAPADGKTSIRAGFGMGIDVLFNNLGTLSKPPQYSSTQDVVLTAQTPSFLANGGLPPGTGKLLTFPSIAAQRAATSAYVPNQVLPYSETWDLSIQRVFLKSYTFEARYTGTRGIHLPTQIQLNKQKQVTAANSLPVFATTTVPTGAGLTNNLNAIRGTKSAAGQYLGQFVPAWIAGGFGPQSATDTLTYSAITSYLPFGASNYNGLALQLTRRMTNGLLLNAAYTYSKSMDNSTAEVFSTTLSPRRPQDFQNLNADYSVSALDHRHRITTEVLYQWKPFKNRNYVMRSLVGNWEATTVYTYQSPEFFTPQSGVDSNLNGDAVDRTYINPNGTPHTGSGTTALVVGGNTVGYYTSATQNPNAYYLQAGAGVNPTGNRNTEAIRPTNNFDVSAIKKLQIFERVGFEFGASAINVVNHPQFTGGTTSTINTPSASGYTGFVQVANSLFNQPKQSFTSNPRVLQLSGKLTF